jgi:hypothetical protein
VLRCAALGWVGLGCGKHAACMHAVTRTPPSSTSAAVLLLLTPVLLTIFACSRLLNEARGSAWGTGAAPPSRPHRLVTKVVQARQPGGRGAAPKFSLPRDIGEGGYIRALPRASTWPRVH